MRANRALAPRHPKLNDIRWFCCAKCGFCCAGLEFDCGILA
jgi:hypothetical protein